MNILMSTIGSRGDVQPLLALACELRDLGHEPRLCAPPNFKEWVESHGIGFVPIGPDVKQLAKNNPSSKPPRPTKARRAQLAEYTIREQFRVLGDAARDCDLLVAGGALQLALRSIAESHGIRYAYVAYCPATLPSPDNPPAKIDVHYPAWLPRSINRLLWHREKRRWNRLFGPALNEARAMLELRPVTDVQGYILGEHPLLAADPTLAPAPVTRGRQIIQRGSWILHDETPLPFDVERFLNDGEPPIYFGFGSMREEKDTGAIIGEAAARLGRRAIVLRGWGDLLAPNTSRDCLVIDDINHDALLPRVAAVVHHGGAGTTHAAARAGTPQVVIPHHYDQFYWAARVRSLGIGTAFSRRRLTADALAASLRRCVGSDVAQRARELAARMIPDGARLAARELAAGTD